MDFKKPPHKRITEHTSATDLVKSQPNSRWLPHLIDFWTHINGYHSTNFTDNDLKFAVAVDEINPQHILQRES